LQLCRQRRSNEFVATGMTAVTKKTAVMKQAVVMKITAVLKMAAVVKETVVMKNLEDHRDEGCHLHKRVIEIIAGAQQGFIMR